MSDIKEITDWKVDRDLHQYPVFPLPIFLLPGGMQTLRIFEPRYLAMIADLHNTQGFVVALYHRDKRGVLPGWGTFVTMVDFDQGEDGILTIDIQAEYLVSLSGFEYQQDGLLTAAVAKMPHWSSDYAEVLQTELALPKEAIQHQLSTLLRDIFESHSQLEDLYKTQYFDYSEWVCARLLEIVPLPLNEKEKFVNELDYGQLIKLLGEMCKKESEKK